MHKRAIIVASILGLVLISGVALAENSNTASDKSDKLQARNERKDIRIANREERRAEIQKKKDEFKALKEKFTAERCARIQERVSKRTTFYDENKARRVNAYLNMKDRVVKFEKRLAGKGYDTSKLKTDLVTLDGKIKQLSTDYAAYINKLKSTNTLACGHAEGDFRSGLLDARELLKTVKADVEDIKNFYQTVIREDIKAIKAQKAENATDEDKTDEAGESETEVK